MPNSDLSQLKRWREACGRRFVERTTSTDATVEELRDLFERVRLADAACAELKPPSKKTNRAIVTIAVGIGVVVTVAAWLPVRSVGFTAEIEARTLSMAMNQDGSLEQQAVLKQIGVEGAADVKSSNKALTSILQGNVQPFALRGDFLRIQNLYWDKGAEFRLVAEEEALRITVENLKSPPVLSLETAGRIELETSDGKGSQAIDTGLGDTVSISTSNPSIQEGGRPPPLVIIVGSAAEHKYKLNGLQPSSLSFVERRPNLGSAIYASSLISANVNIPLNNSVTTLYEGDRIGFDGLSLERIDVVVGKTIAIRISGRASELRSSVGGFERSLKPSVLEWLTRHHTLKLFWSAAVFLWGAYVWFQMHFKNP